MRPTEDVHVYDAVIRIDHPDEPQEPPTYSVLTVAAHSQREADERFADLCRYEGLPKTIVRTGRVKLVYNEALSESVLDLADTEQRIVEDIAHLINHHEQRPSEVRSLLLAALEKAQE